MPPEQAANSSSEKEKTFRVPRWHSFTAALLARVCYATYRKTILDPYQCRARMFQEPFIFVCWHNRLLFAPFYIPRKKRSSTAALASYSKDGEYAAAYIQEFSGQVVRGSSSRGGSRAVIEMLRFLRGGNSVVITPDGPRGPRYTVHPGAVILAQKSQIPLVPVSLNASRRWELNGWDRTQIPKPFSRVTLQYGTPFVLEKGNTDGSSNNNGIEEATEQVKHALFEVTDDTDLHSE